VISSGGENYGLVRPADDETSLAVQGWLSGQASTALFRDAGLDLAALRVAARRADFRPVPLAGLSFSADIPVTHEIVGSRNVLAKIPGAKRPDEVVMLGAHWDAYGIGAPDAQGRTIRAGANDDAIGLAALLEIARAFKAGPPPARSLVFAAWTAEERGLLGSDYYAANPIYPLERTVANLTVDVLQTAGSSRNDVVLIGKGQGALEDDHRPSRGDAGPHRHAGEACPSAGCSIAPITSRFAKRGVPVLLMMGLAGASDLVEGGREGRAAHGSMPIPASATTSPATPGVTGLEPRRSGAWTSTWSARLAVELAGTAPLATTGRTAPSSRPIRDAERCAAEVKFRAGFPPTHLHDCPRGSPCPAWSGSRAGGRSC
jgi:hypothetical protein